MSRRVGSIRATVVISAAVAAVLGVRAVATEGAIQNANYVGATGGNWGVPGNWSGGVVPANNGETFAVSIPDSTIVTLDLGGTTSIDMLMLGGLGASVDVPLGSSLVVLGDLAGNGGLMDVRGSLNAGNGTSPPGLSSRISVSNGGTAVLNVPVYRMDSHLGNVLSADGANSLVDLSQAQSFNGAIGGVGQRQNIVRASNGAVIDLSGLTSVIGAAGSDDLLRFSVNTGGQIKLDHLIEVTGRTWFDLGVGATMDLAKVQTVTGATITLGDGSTLNAPMLQTLAGSALSYSPGRTLNLGPVSSVDQTFLAVSGGATLALPGVGSYRMNPSFPSRTLLSADGAASLLDLSVVLRIEGGAFNQPGSVYTVLASNGGAIDLSSLVSVHWMSNFTDSLRFSAQSGGQLKLDGLHRVTGFAEFDVGPDATLMLGDVSMNGGVPISVTDASAKLTTGDLWLWPQASLTAVSESQVVINGSFSFAANAEPSLVVDRSVIQLGTSAKRSLLEVGGTDAGVNGFTSGNFGIGRLEIGRPGEAAIVELKDRVDNGNRAGGMAEALYLFGINGGDGLVIHPGSVLNFGGLNVYAFMGGQWVWLNEMFGGGGEVSFGGGTLIREPGSLLPGDADGDGDVDGNDVAIWAVNFTGSGTTFGRTWYHGDFDGEGDVDGDDVALWALNFTGALVSASPVAVPEPIAGPLALCALRLLVRRRQRVEDQT